MKIFKVLSVLVALTGLVALAVVVAPAAYGRQRAERPFGSAGRSRELTVLAGRGAAIGVSIRDVQPAEAGGDRASQGVLVDDVRRDSPAEKAGVKRGDVIVEFDGEHVRSARQFSRLVQETVPGRTVKATILRDGKRSDVQVTPDDRRSDMMISGDFGDYMRDLGRDLGRLGDHLPA